jgi:uncharacterized protein (TIGR01244 family)
MTTTRINDRLSIAGQPAPADFADLAAQGFSAVLNLRPDGEEAGQPGNAAERRAAGESGPATVLSR